MILNHWGSAFADSSWVYSSWGYGGTSGDFFSGEFYDGQFFGDGATPPATTDAPTGAGGRRRKKRVSYRVRYNGREYEVESLQEVSALAQKFKEQAQAELLQLPPRAQRRKAKRPAARIEIPAEVQQELYRYDLPDVAPLLAKHDFENLRIVMDRLEAIRRQLDDDEDDAQALMLLL